jgi:hypothetical protein
VKFCANQAENSHQVSRVGAFGKTAQSTSAPDASMMGAHLVADCELQKGEEANRGIVDGALKAANESAKDAAPFLHPRLSAVEHKGEQFNPIAEILKLIDGTSRGLPDPARIPKDPDELIDVAPATPEPQAPAEALPAAVQLPPEPIPRRPHRSIASAAPAGSPIRAAHPGNWEVPAGPRQPSQGGGLSRAFDGKQVP